MELDTGFKKVFTSFIEYETSSNLRVENHYCEGEITGNVYMNVILYRSDKPVEFEDNTIANLKDNRLEYYSGLRISDNFSMYMKLKDINPDSYFLKFIDMYDIPITFYYYTYKEYDTIRLHNTNGTDPEKFNRAIVEYKPYFSIKVGNQCYVTSFFSSASSLEDLSKKHYSIAMSKHRDIINLKIKEIIS